MDYVINLLLTGRKLAFSDEKSKSINVVSNNDCFYVKLKCEEVLPAAVFARFIKNGNIISDVLLDSECKCKIPRSMLDNGYFEAGFYTDGFATTPLKIKVLSSVVFKDGIEDAGLTPSQTEQLIALVNSAPFVENAFVNDSGELALNMKNGTLYIAGKVVGEKGEKGDKGDKGEKGDRGYKGDKGDSYVLTEEDKMEIASFSASIIDASLLEILGTGVE